MASRRRTEEIQRPRRPAATTPDGRENQLVELAVDLAERQLLEGTASSQVISHYLKLGSSRERLEQERLRNENELMAAKRHQIEQGTRIEDLMTDAINAMRSYKGEVSDERYDD